MYFEETEKYFSKTGINFSKSVFLNILGSTPPTDPNLPAIKITPSVFSHPLEFFKIRIQGILKINDIYKEYFVDGLIWDYTSKVGSIITYDSHVLTLKPRLKTRPKFLAYFNSINL